MKLNGITMQISASRKPVRSYTLLGYQICRAEVAQDNILKVHLSTVRPVLELEYVVPVWKAIQIYAM